MKKKLIVVLFITLASGMSLMAQTKKKAKGKSSKRTTKTVKPVKTPAVDTTAKMASVADPLPANNMMDTLRSVPDSDDGYLKGTVISTARPFPIFDPNPNNIKYYHQYKREILLKDPRNAKFNTPGSTLIDAILKGIKDGVIVPYDATPTKTNPNGDLLTQPLTYNALYSRLRDTVTVPKLDADGNVIGSVKKLNDYSPNKIIGYRIKEDVYYDKQRAKVETRIVSLAPLVLSTLSNGDTTGKVAICWLRYKQCRDVFAKMDVSDPDRNLYDLSMDDMFLQRQFNGVIIFESNPKGDRIEDYMHTPEDRAREAARIEKKLEDYKNNIWKYQTSITAVSVPDKMPETKVKSKKTPKSKTVTAADNSTGTPVKQ